MALDALFVEQQVGEQQQDEDQAEHGQHLRHDLTEESECLSHSCRVVETHHRVEHEHGREKPPAAAPLCPWLLHGSGKTQQLEGVDGAERHGDGDDKVHEVAHDGKARAQQHRLGG